MIKPNKDMSYTDVMLLWGMLNFEHFPSTSEKIDTIIEIVDSYEIDYSNPNIQIAIKFIKPMETTIMKVTI